ncbi:hypothetical protein E2C01_006110 [Portunus trituberculatus]|uniref:Uncharacterized protein n=1 Tax=Portunus trituberculatus TaxID=210409 RepID=A0A5B7CW10_PORTR|nr:hypothetical protein [Portunus trituberculatus]
MGLPAVFSIGTIRRHDRLGPPSRGNTPKLLSVVGLDLGEGSEDVAFSRLVCGTTIDQKVTGRARRILSMTLTRSNIRRLTSSSCNTIASPAREEKEDEEDGSSGGRDGAVGRSGHRSSRATSSRTPPTLASVTRELTDSKSNNRDPETSISSDRGSKTGDSAPLRNSPLPLVSLPLSKGEEVESETEDQPEEEDGKAKQKDKDEKKKRKRKKKRRKMKKTKSKGETTEEEEEEREREQEDEQRKGSNVESPEMKVESLRKSTALVLFRNFAKTVYAPRHSQFKLFSNLEDLEEVSPSTGPLSPAAKGTPRL